MISPTSPLLPLYLSEFLFGMLYAGLIHWLSIRRIMQGSTALSVVVGNGATLFIYWLYAPQNWEPLTAFLCFAFSGLPMFVTYVYRYEQRKKSHKAKKLPPKARRIRDEIVMDLNMVTDEIAAKFDTAAPEVHKLHHVIAVLKDL